MRIETAGFCAEKSIKTRRPAIPYGTAGLVKVPTQAPWHTSGLRLPSPHGIGQIPRTPRNGGTLTFTFEDPVFHLFLSSKHSLVRPYAECLDIDQGNAACFQTSVEPKEQSNESAWRFPGHSPKG